MSTVTTKKLQRYAVTYRGRLIFKNATSHDEALAMVRTDLIKEGVRQRDNWIMKHGPNPVALDPRYPTMLSSALPIDEALGTFESFKARTACKVSLRY